MEEHFEHKHEIIIPYKLPYLQKKIELPDSDYHIYPPNWTPPRQPNKGLKIGSYNSKKAKNK